jgi:cation diffusion facilitator CzcD-associated flavoprotein CzcO
MKTSLPVAVIGAGPCGLAAVRNFQKLNIPCVGFEVHSDVGGLWDIENPMSTVYQSAHLIASKTMMDYHEFRFKDHVAEYPHHAEMKKYFHDYVEHFDLRKYYQFNTKVENCERDQDGNWDITTTNLKTNEKTTQKYSHLVIANGIFNFANMPKIKGQETFKGEIIHSSKYKHSKMFDDKKVLIVGAGNTGCDIAVDAVHHAQYVDMSVRRGYYFVPKYIFGKPADTLGSGMSKLPMAVKNTLQDKIFKMYIPDPTKYGFPKPDYKPFESHPIVNSLILHHLGHGDLEIMADIDYIDGNKVFFKDGDCKEYDLIVCCTGYKLHYPFIDKKYLNWKEGESCPNLYLNIFNPEFNNVFILGMIEATGIGWQGRYDQAELVAKFVDKELKGQLSDIQTFMKEKKDNATDMRAGMNYLKLERMSFYVHKETYMKKVRKTIQELTA